jgi:7,8-dihydroneopterin aldolase/epimerase/oxygenase
MADVLRLCDLEVRCRIGVYEWERRTRQTVRIDLELPIDASAAARRDDVRDAVDYAALVDRIRAVAAERPFNLVETLAEAVAAAVLNTCGSPRVTVCVKKRALTGLGYAAVEIERTRRSAPPRRLARPVRFRPGSAPRPDRQRVRAVARPSSE